MPKTMTVHDEITKATKIKRAANEKDQVWLKRCMIAIGDLHDTDFNKLSYTVTDWHEKAVEAHNSKLPLPAFPDMEEQDEPADEDDEPEELQDSTEESTNDEGEEEPEPAPRAQEESEEPQEPEIEQEDKANNRKTQPRIRDTKGNLVKRHAALRLLVIQNPKINNDDLLERCSELGIDLAEPSIKATAYHTRSTVKVLQEQYGFTIPEHGNNHFEVAKDSPKESKSKTGNGAKQQKRRGRPPKKAVDSVDEDGENDSDD